MTDVSAVLAQLEPRLGAITEGPSSLEGGITNRNYLVRFGARRCVVRLPGKDTSLLAISREAERLANEAAAKLEIAPAVLAAGPNYLVTQYVEGRAADAQSLADAPQSAASALRAFHDCGVQLPARFWVPDLLGDYAAVIEGRGVSPPDWLERVKVIVGRIAELVPLSEPVPSHNDLLPANLLWLEGGGVMLVDWEYAGMGHRLFDLANLAVNAGFGRLAEERMLTAYFGEPPSEERKRALRLMRIVSDAREAAWGAVQAVVSDLDFDFDGYGLRHYERLAGAAAEELELRV